MSNLSTAARSGGSLSKLGKLYYILRPLFPRWFQLWLRRRVAKYRFKAKSQVWPIDVRCADKPREWRGWPESKRFVLVLTHDVESWRGVARCRSVLAKEQDLGIRSSFNFVPLRYEVPAELREHIEREGFEVGIHGLYHDGKLYESWQVFCDRATRINQFLAEWDVVGFRSPSMHHNLSWIRELNIEYDASTFDTDPFEPQPDGICTIFPMWIDSEGGKSGYVELPYTLPQDSTLFTLLRYRDIHIWREKLEWIADAGGVALLNTHLDYMYFGNGRPTCDEYPVELYWDFLNHIKERYSKEVWHVLPRELAEFWKTRMMRKNPNSRKST